MRPQSSGTAERHRQAVELVDEIDHLESVMRDSRARITIAVSASGTTLTEMFGVGPIVACMLIGFSGDPSRFTTASRYAAYTGTAPVEFSSGGRITHWLSRRGNRRLNHALHIAAVTQIRHHHSEGRRYYERKLAEGHTPAKRSVRSNRGVDPLDPHPTLIDQRLVQPHPFPPLQHDRRRDPGLRQLAVLQQVAEQLGVGPVGLGAVPCGPAPPACRAGSARCAANPAASISSTT